MIAEEKPYGVKALYSHVGSIPEQLSFKRNELLLIDGHMEGWFSASVIGQPERRGWIPNNYVQRDDSIVIPAAQQKKSKSRRGSAMNPTAAAALNGSAAAAADAPKRGSISVSSTAPSTVEPTHSPGPTIGHMSSAHHVHAQGESANKPVLLEALYDFVAEHPDQQLSFQKGDVFILHNKDDPDWFDVKNQETGQIGAVPALYLRELINVDQQVVREVMQQEKDAAAGESASSSSNPNHLTLQTGDTGGKSNLPEASPLASGAQAVSSTPMAAPTPIAGAPTPLGASPAGASSSPIPEEATHRAAYSFTASAAGQLSYAKGDLFQLLSKDHEGWHRFKHFASGMQGLGE
jgi:hypothetical protein